MERMKVSLGWQIWGWLTLLASLSVHGFLLGLPISLDLEAPEPEPEPIATVPLTTLPVNSLQQSETEKTTAQTESENVSAEEETYEPESENVSAEEETYEPDEVTTPPFATTVSQRRIREESTALQQPDVTSSETNTSNFRHKKRRLDGLAPKVNPNPALGGVSSDIAGEVDNNLKDAVKNIDEGIQEYLARLPEDDEEGTGSLLKDIDQMYFYLATSPQLTDRFFEVANSSFSLGNLKPGVLEITFVINPEKKDKAIEITTLYDEFIQPYLARKGFQIETLPNQGELQFYQAKKNGLVRHVMLAPIPKNTGESDSSETSEIFGTFIVLYNPEVLNVGL
ncbi:hypothetical protein IQ235_09480 [Oscillatoriales cyanobacterium LEGE 11467]|uniref:Uncharacterized protein n=1 Tax=Zarconia navalis LEGE 11467 TaxID=1828826 RepID=A0A928W0F2_9CYAN|nr:hypothetical protein [Zarconia navalis]MBE9041010.1 hypothetical protein [Zarconia navalis LEGE 11467]